MGTSTRHVEKSQTRPNKRTTKNAQRIGAHYCLTFPLVYALDTNAIIYYIKDDQSAVDFLRDILASPDSPVYVSAITEAELFGFPSLTDTEATLINDLLGGVSIIPIDSYIARTAGRIRATYRLKLADSLVAATAIFTSSAVVTRNVRDFRKVPTISIQHL